MQELNGNELNTTHNRMEMQAVIKAIDWVKSENIEFKKINVYLDSQYVVNIKNRIGKLKRNEFLTKKKAPIQNSDLLQALINVIETNNISFIKVIAHQKPTETVNYNREVDKMARKMVRDYVKINHN